MVDRAELFEVADAMVGEGKTPSTRTVRDRLRKRGSFSDVALVLAQWCVERKFRPRPTVADVPDHLGAKLAKLAAEIWHDGHREGAVAAQNELQRVAAERDALETGLVEAFTMVDGLEKTIKLLGEGVPAQAAKLSQQRSENIAFWKKVMSEIVVLLGTRSLSAAQIIDELSSETVQRAKEIEADWCPANLADRLRGRVRNEKHFEEPAQGVFCRLRSPEVTKLKPKAST